MFKKIAIERTLEEVRAHFSEFKSNESFVYFFSFLFGCDYSKIKRNICYEKIIVLWNYLLRIYFEGDLTQNLKNCLVGKLNWIYVLDKSNVDFIKVNILAERHIDFFFLVKIIIYRSHCISHKFDIRNTGHTAM